MAKQIKEVTEEDIQKAYETLGISPEVETADQQEDIRKGEDQEDIQNDESEDTKKEDETSAEKEDEPKDDDDDDDDKEVKKGGKPNRFDAIEKAIADSHNENKLFIKALGVMMKDSAQRLEKATTALEAANTRVAELEDLVKAQGETITSMSDALESFGSKPIQKAAVHSNPVDRHFAKGDDDDLNGGKKPENENRVSASLQKAAVLEILDQATTANGYDEEFSKACMTFEASGFISDRVKERVKKEFGFEIVK